MVSIKNINMSSKVDWLNNFVEKNAWSIFIALIMVVLTYGNLVTRVKANEERINTLEEAQAGIVENQKSIINLQVNQANMASDISEIKLDIKTLIAR